VIEAVCNKLVYRHPHIYSNVKVSNEQEVKENWEKLKQKERNKSILSGVPDALPALIKALRIQDKSKQIGFEWDTTEQVQAKVKEELDELQEAMEENNQDHIEEEFGDVLFSLVNLARFLNVDLELALERTNRKFMDRFNKMEVLAEENGKSLLDMNLEEMDALWNYVKSKR
jgi:XTP/dITP diphosphohydrolase